MAKLGLLSNIPENKPKNSQISCSSGFGLKIKGVGCPVLSTSAKTFSRSRKNIGNHPFIPAPGDTSDSLKSFSSVFSTYNRGLFGEIFPKYCPE
jgi:hypothetical protein